MEHIDLITITMWEHDYLWKCHNKANIRMGNKLTLIRNIKESIGIKKIGSSHKNQYESIETHLDTKNGRKEREVEIKGYN